MAEEIQEAIQVIRVAYEGVEIALKLGSGTLGQAKRALEFLFALLEREKTMGKTAMKKLLLRGGDLQIFQFQAEELRQGEKLAKKYGILYSVLPDINHTDGKREILFHTEAVPRANLMIQKLNQGKIATFDDYLDNGKEQELKKLLSFLPKNGKTEKEKPEYQAWADRIQAASLAQSNAVLEIPVANDQLIEENHQAVKVKIPTEKGEESRFFWIEKENLLEPDPGKGFRAFLETEQEYSIYSDENRIASTMTGNELYDRYYNQVEKELRKREEQEERVAKQERNRKAERKSKVTRGKKRLSQSSQNAHQPTKKPRTR